MAKLSEEYIRLTNDVIAVNYWGELLTVELLSGLLKRDLPPAFQSIIPRQLMDETRHANVTRAFLRERGRDPVAEDGVAEFTYDHLFREWSDRSVEEILVFLGCNERSSSRNFSSLVRVGMAEEDEALVTIYSEILNDEVNHAHNIFHTLPDAQQPPGLVEQAEAAMRSAFNKRYGRLLLAYPSQFGVKPAAPRVRGAAE